MRGGNSVIYYLTMPIRLFGRSRAVRFLLIGALVVGAAFYGTLWALDSFLPPASAPAALTKVPPPPPLPDVSRQSVVIAPVAIALTAIRDSLDASTPRDFSGTSKNPVTQLLGDAEIGLTVARGPMAVTGDKGALTVTTPLNGSIRITGKLGAETGRGLGGALGGLLGGNVGRQIENFAGKALDQRSDFRGSIATSARPALTAAWRLEPNLAARLDFGDTALNVAGVRINVGNEIRPMLEPAINSQVSALEGRLRNDPTIERIAREQWAKMCRSIPLGGGDTGLPQLWLEMKPVRAAAAQPKIDARNVTLTVGVQTDTRITPKQTKPECPFPAQLELVPPMQDGKLTVGLPIDVPFTAINKLLEAQLKGRKFPEDGNGPAEVEVRGVHIAAAGDRLLISLKVNAVEKKSWFGFGANATVHIWGKPALDQKNQILRMTDLTLAIDSDAAYGLLSAAARAALPYLEQGLAEQAVVDLKPFAADARKKIADALADFREVTQGTRVDAAINDLRLTGIAFDADTMRIIAEAGGTVRATVTALPKM
jgi:hypothetical protein